MRVLKVFSHSLMTFLLLSSISCFEKEDLASVTTGDCIVYPDRKSVSCKGVVEKDGESKVTQRGICYIQGIGTPTITNHTVSGGSGEGSFSCPFSVTKNGIYSYRAYAKNSLGTAYGEVKTFSVAGLIDDFVGKYSFSGYDYFASSYEQWNDVIIDTFDGPDNDTWVYVEGLYLGISSFVAIGKIDQTNKCIRLFSDLHFENRTFTYGESDTIFYATFNPIAQENENLYWLSGGHGYQNTSEAWLSFDNEWNLRLGPSNYPDDDGRYASGFTFKYFEKESNSYQGYFPVYTNVKLIKK